MWLYIYCKNAEYSYKISDGAKKVFLKDVSLYYDGLEQKKGFDICKIKEGSVLYRSASFKHSLLKPSYWLSLALLIPLCFVLYCLMV